MARGSVIAFAFALFLGSSLAASTGTTESSTTAAPDRSSGDEKTKEMSSKDSENSEETTAMMNFMLECNETYRVEMAYMDALIEGGSFPDETDRTPKCFVRCLLEKLGIASEDGKYDPAVTAAYFSSTQNEEKIKEAQDLATTCASNRNESCKCNRAYQFIKCLMEAEIKADMSGSS
uniref:Odorant binding protein n=1 Tax=Glyphodes pyloalis TaxID=1242752 RepID=A0A6M3GXP0_GLYPY|nr:odorant binding protein [Glyphodes pyloalis]